MYKVTVTTLSPAGNIEFPMKDKDADKCMEQFLCLRFLDASGNVRIFGDRHVVCVEYHKIPDNSKQE